MEKQDSGVLSTLLAGVPSEWRIWLILLIIVALILIVILFRHEIGGLLKRISDVAYDKDKGLSLHFGENLKQALQQKNRNANLTQGGDRESKRRQVRNDIFPLSSSGKPAAQLRGISGPIKGMQFLLEKEVVTIGANPENDLVISGDSFVSGNHAYLRYDKGYVMLSDLHSRNGTFLNGTRLKEASMIVKVGDRIGVGNSTFELI